MLLKALRNGVGSIIVFLDWISRPKGINRSPQEQEKVQAAMQGLSLYQLYACPFCVKTRRALRRLNITIPINDIGKDSAHREALKNGGGRTMVPCLKIDDNNETRWLYESSDIIAFLEQRTQLSQNLKG